MISSTNGLPYFFCGGPNQTAAIAMADKISCARATGAQTAITIMPQQLATISNEETLL
jgi:hypothetical protein